MCTWKWKYYDVAVNQQTNPLLTVFGSHPHIQHCTNKRIVDIFFIKEYEIRRIFILIQMRLYLNFVPIRIRAKKIFCIPFPIVISLCLYYSMKYLMSRLDLTKCQLPLNKIYFYICSAIELYQNSLLYSLLNQTYNAFCSSYRTNAL